MTDFFLILLLTSMFHGLTIALKAKQIKASPYLKLLQPALFTPLAEIFN